MEQLQKAIYLTSNNFRLAEQEMTKNISNLLFTLFALTMFVITLINRPLAAAEEELATPMAQLQTLTHKLNLATHHKNPELIRFYLEESLVMLGDIQETIPEYQQLPIAVFIDRFARPAYAPLQVLLRKSGNALNPDELKTAMQSVINSCNSCHEATKFGFIKITYNTDNPFNQDFNP